MIFRETTIQGVTVVEPELHTDERGFFARTWDPGEFAAHGLSDRVVQVSMSFNRRRGTLRGLHYQAAPHEEAKLVRCTQGAIFDVAVDLRRGSPTFLRWHAETLSDENGVALLIPEGFAHGLQTLAADVDMLYCHSAAYTASAEGGLHPRDPRLAIDWPLPIAALSPRDGAHALLGADFAGLAP